MSGHIHAEPVWAGLAVRLADGTLWAVELDKEITADIDVNVEAIETTDPFRDTFRSWRAGEIRVKATIEGVGRTVTRIGSDMGADRRPAEIEPPQRAIEGRH